MSADETEKAIEKDLVETKKKEKEKEKKEMIAMEDPKQTEQLEVTTKTIRKASKKPTNRSIKALTFCSRRRILLERWCKRRRTRRRGRTHVTGWN